MKQAYIRLTTSCLIFNDMERNFLKLQFHINDVEASYKACTTIIRTKSTKSKQRIGAKMHIKVCDVLLREVHSQTYQLYFIVNLDRYQNYKLERIANLIDYVFL